MENDSLFINILIICVQCLFYAFEGDFCWALSDTRGHSVYEKRGGRLDIVNTTGESDDLKWRGVNRSRVDAGESLAV